MKHDKPATQNPTDRKKVIGKATDRYEGKLKTTGTAKYAYEWHDIAPKPAYGYVLGAAIAKGRIVSIDTGAAESAPGVYAVVTAQNAGPLDQGKFQHRQICSPDPKFSTTTRPWPSWSRALSKKRARPRARSRCATPPSPVRTISPRRRTAAQKPPAQFGTEPDSAAGDFNGAFAAAPVKFDATYTTPDQTHAMMEPFASIAAWKGDELTVWTANQMIAWARGDLAKTLQMDPAKVRVVSPYIGGGFGGKLFLRSDVLLAALGARAAKRPVKVALPRPLMANNSTHRPATIQRVRLGATADGKITAFAHETWSGNLPGGSAEMGILASRALYAGANRMTATRLATLDLPEGNAMRAPGDAPGLDGVRSGHRRNGAPAETGSCRIPHSQRHAAGSRRNRRACTPLASWSNACAPARKNSAGTAATRSPARCATAAGSWGWAWRPPIAERPCSTPRRACGSMHRVWSPSKPT